jgi:hypothetical protein
LGSWSRKDLVRDEDAVKAAKQQMKGKVKAKDNGNAAKCKQPEEHGEGDGGAGKKARKT